MDRGAYIEFNYFASFAAAEERRYDVGELTDRVALVTGAGRRVGAAIAGRLAERGAAVAVNDLDPARAEAVAAEIRARGGTAAAAPADVTDPAAVEGLYDRVAGDLGSVDILVNNAGIPATGISLSTFADSAPEDWAPLVALNSTGVMACTRAALGPMIARGWGRIVTIGSDSARVGDPGMAVYGATKASAAALMRAVAREVGPHGVTCNTLLLGTIRTPEMTDDLHDRLARRYPVGRLGLPEDVAAAVLWLASPASAWLTAQTIPLNGGYAAG
ncbi:SDR family oxidoreductase [Nocardioides sp. YIM 152588]|uniref:SDR family NAD(P)-dependent oxidoreductase n=1 Tax=Nocardioides sp. YIM 152588 TaxID=3158259 RepID=UPI0032E4DAF7